MLRTLAIVLIAANVLFLGFTRGWFDGTFGLRSTGDREPERLAGQVRPESVVLRPVAASATVAGTPTRCLEAGPFDSSEAFAVEASLQRALPGGGWTDVRSEAAQQWLVFVGPFASREAMQRRIDELRRANIDAEEATAASDPGLGIALARLDDRAAAERTLGELSARGARAALGARVATAPAAAPGHVYRIAAADAQTASQLLGLRLGAATRSFSDCAGAPAR